MANGFDSIIPTMLSGLSDALIGLVVLLVLSASMSTLSSLVIASSSTLTLDFINKNFIKDMSEKTQVRMIRVAYCGIHFDFGRYCSDPVQQFGDFHCAAYGDFLGCIGGFIPWPAYLWPVLEEDNEEWMLGKALSLVQEQ